MCLLKKKETAKICLNGNLVKQDKVEISQVQKPVDGVGTN